MIFCQVQPTSLRFNSMHRIHLDRMPIRYGSEIVEKEGKTISLLFRHFIYVKLRVAGEVCKNLPSSRKNA